MPLSYIDWNNLLIKYYFNDEMASRDVIIFVDREMIDSIGSPYNEGFDDFRRKVMEGPPWAGRDGVCQKAVAAAKNWRSKLLEYPPYFAYLVLFVYAATVGDFDAKAYYPRLRQVLGEEEVIGQYPSFDKMDNLWADLEKWSVEDKHESLGRFTKRIRGGWAHVGLPLSQVIITESERKMLPRFFREGGLDPVDPPSEGVLLGRLALWGRRLFGHRTIVLLTSTEDTLSDLREAIAGLIMNDLRDWDGVYDNEKEIDPSTTPQQHKQVLAGAHICMELDEFSSNIKATIRIKANRSFPDDGLAFNFNGTALTCEGTSAQGWSTRLMAKLGSDPYFFDPSCINWLKSYTFTDNDEAWISRLRGATVRIFLPGITEGLSGWVEFQRVLPLSKYLICCHKSMMFNIAAWGPASNSTFRHIVVKGLPQDWELFEAEDIKVPYNGIDALALPKTSFLHIQGGIRIGRTNRYLSLAPPQVIVEGGSDVGRVSLNGITLSPISGQGSKFKLPQSLPLDTLITIELHGIDGAPIQKRVIYLTSPSFPAQPAKSIIRDRFGKPYKNLDNLKKEGTIWGVTGVVPIGANITSTVDDIGAPPTYLSHHIIFLGKVAGQVVDWPDEDLPIDWQPIWAVAKTSRKNWQVYFCGKNDVDVTPQTKSVCISSREVKRWKSVIYGMRKQLIPPKFKRFQLIWREYSRCAEHV